MLASCRSSGSHPNCPRRGHCRGESCASFTSSTWPASAPRSRAWSRLPAMGGSNSSTASILNCGATSSGSRACLRPRTGSSHLVRAIPDTQAAGDVARALLGQQDRWVLKPHAGAAGEGVVVGREQSASDWRAAVERATQRPGWVAQRLVSPRPDEYRVRRRAEWTGRASQGDRNARDIPHRGAVRGSVRALDSVRHRDRGR